MKRPFSLLLCLSLLLALLPGCVQQESVDSPSPENPDLTAKALAAAAFSGSGCADPDNVEYLNADEKADQLAIYVENAYMLEDAWEEAAIIRATGASAFELAVLRLTDDSAAVRAATSLMSYIFARQGDFTGYAPDQANMVAAGGLRQDGPWVGLFICPDPDGADAAFLAALSGAGLSAPVPAQDLSEEDIADSDPDYPDRYRYTPPTDEDMSIYDTSAIRTAWETGAPSSLSDYDRAVYNAAKEILGKILTDGMSDAEKETAIYGWLVDNVDYDWTHQDVLASTPRASYEPYGGLVNHVAVCLGYATSFQLLMDLAGVECITVVGAAFNSEDAHGWNMVRLDGNWYCVDVTWDANGREQLGEYYTTWQYFNITSDEMALNHQWDYANTPEAVTVW